MPTLEPIGKDKVMNHHLDVPYRVLERQHSYVSIQTRATLLTPTTATAAPML